MKISGVILAKDSEVLIARAITSLRRFDEVVVYDTGSTDKTASVAAMFGCKVIKGMFEMGFATMKNKAIGAAINEHVFVLDADEFIDPDVYYELKLNFNLNPNIVFAFNRLNMYDMKNYITDWYPDPQMRAFNRRVCMYEKPVHEILMRGPCKVKRSKYRIYHNLCDDRLRNVCNQVHYAKLQGRALGVGKAQEIVERNLARGKKPVEELERSNV